MNYNFSHGSLHAYLETLARERGSETAITDCDVDGNSVKEYTYQQLHERVSQVAAWLQSRFAKGDVIALGLSNSSDVLITSWAAWSCGIITSPLDMKRDTHEQLAYKVNITNAKAIIGTDSLLQSLNIAVLALPVSFDGEAQFEEGIEHEALILFTSGTTAHPKGARLRLRSLLANGESIQEWFQITHNDTFMVVLPLHHINSTTFCFSALLGGAKITIPPRYSHSHFWQQAATTGATFTSIVQTICYDQLQRLAEFEKLKKQLALTRIQIGSAPVVVSDAQAFIDKTGIKLFQGYGQTETALRATGVPLNDAHYEERVADNCIGRPVKWADVGIMDSEGNLLAEGKEGEIVVRGPIVMDSYLKDPQPFRNGWFLTGDIGYFTMIDDVEYFYMKGRSKEIIIKGGVNISPVAVEDALKKINKNIDQVYVFGVNDERYGERIACAIIWKQEDFANLQWQLLHDNEHLSSFETPHYYTSIATAELPTTSTGKVQRSILKQQVADKLQEIDVVAQTSSTQFVFLTPASVHAKAAFGLFNQCWDPLSIDKTTLHAWLSNGVSLGAIQNGTLVGMISFIRTELSEEELSQITYDQITADKTLRTHKPNGKNIVCVSICSATYQASDVRLASATTEQLRSYLPEDPVYAFHHKAKGGADGAELVGLIEGARPEDQRSLGYAMLLKYPHPQGKLPDASRSIATQLIEVVLLYAHERDIDFVYAYSRPAGAHVKFGD